MLHKISSFFIFLSSFLYKIRRAVCGFCILLRKESPADRQAILVLLRNSFFI